MTGRAGRRADRGSATVWSLGLIGVLLALFAAVLWLDRAVVARHRAGGAADLAALAAADHALDGEAAACALAAQVAKTQGAELTGCRLTGEVADVVAEVGGARVASRAGPSLAAGSAADAVLHGERAARVLSIGPVDQGRVPGVVRVAGHVHPPVEPVPSGAPWSSAAAGTRGLWSPPGAAHS
ncbi:Rv3654c family TadE-like protein [Streptomyces sp. NBC_01190]|uniref:Rv3654c family TadE-like protein n=1 Tax=Streptomyces sp. NBC_01190 TaxID=2903767 RepID=UPI00387043C8|nr:flp pilus-assembly TadE/G-like family protein [Streptomyces sp. NBC_01190]